MDSSPPLVMVAVTAVLLHYLLAQHQSCYLLWVAHRSEASTAAFAAKQLGGSVAAVFSGSAKYGAGSNAI